MVDLYREPVSVSIPSLDTVRPVHNPAVAAQLRDAISASLASCGGTDSEEETVFVVYVDPVAGTHVSIPANPVGPGVHGQTDADA